MTLAISCYLRRRNGWSVVAPRRAFVIYDLCYLRVAQLRTESGHLRGVLPSAYDFSGKAVQDYSHMRVGISAVDYGIAGERRENARRSRSRFAVT